MKAKRRVVPLHFPVKGLDEHWANQAQPILTSPDALNVRSYGEIEGRARGGQRPGTRKAYYDRVDGDYYIRLLEQVSFSKAADDYTGVDEDAFDRPYSADLGDGWETAVWTNRSIRIGSGQHAEEMYEPTSGQFSANVRRALAGFSAAVTYTAQFELVRTPSSLWHNQWWHLYLRLDDTAPDIETDGVDVCIKVSYSDQGSYTGYLKDFVSASEVSDTAFTPGSFGAGSQRATLRVEVLGNAITVKVDGTTVCTKTVSAHGGKRMGIGTHRNGHNPVDADNWLVTGVLVQGQPTPMETRLTAVANGDLYEEATPGQLTEVAGAVADFSTVHLTQGQEQGHKLYIADHDDEKVTYADGVIGGAGHNELTSASVSDWTTLGIDTDNDVCTLSVVTGPTAGVYEIATVAAAKVTLAASAVADGSCTFRIERAPKVYDPSNGSVALWLADTGNGFMPVGCQLVALYRNRVVLARHATDLKNWYMSRQDDPLDWDYGQEDAQAAVAGHNANAGKLGQPVTALIPFSDDILVFGCEHSIWAMVGDPTAGGVIDAVSYETGILGGEAWCQDPNGLIYFMGTGGFYQMAPGGKPENLSYLKLPKALGRINTEIHEVFLEWDSEHFGVHIFITAREDDTSIHYFYDARSDAFWPEKMPQDHGPTAVLNYKATTLTYRHMLMGGRDGYIRRYGKGEKNDDGTAIESYVTFAPQETGGEGYDGVVTRLFGVLAAGSDSLDYEIRTGDSHEQAVAATARHAGKWRRQGLNHPDHNRSRGESFCLRLSNGRIGENWAFEKAGAVVKQGGRVRV